MCYRDGVMASDSRVSSGTQFVESDRCKKIFRLPGGSLFGAAGDYEGTVNLHKALFLTAKKALKDDKPPALPNIRVRKTWAILVSPDGKMHLYNQGSWFSDNKFSAYYAIGSGEVVAMGAMDAGATAVEAVKIGIKRNPFCGGRVQTLEL